jgi:ATP-dependent DNA ligase
MQLYSLTTSGQIKTIILHTSGSKLISEWGILDGKMQRTEKVCVPMNEGKSNATTPGQQAILEMNAKIKRKMEEGYSESMPKKGTTVVMTALELDKLPTGFCPSKPVSKCPSKVEKNLNTYAQRKMNGNCIILVKSKERKVYSRGMKELTSTMLQIPEVQRLMNSMETGDMLNTEIRFVNKSTGKESTAAVGSLVRTKDPVEAMQKYKELSKIGNFEICVFDILFHENKFIGNTTDYLDRYELIKRFNMKSNGIFVPVIIRDWKKHIELAKKEGWEGFVLRVPGDSFVTYTTNGKADRAGCWKWKFMKEGDFVVSEVALGKAGKHAKVYARFKLGQYKDGELLDCGWAGPGTLSHDQLAEYTRDINSKKLKLPFVVEVEFRDWQEDSYCLEHPVIQRIRFDKEPKECEYEG